MQENPLELDNLMSPPLQVNDSADIAHYSGIFLTGLKEKHLVS